MSENVWEGFRVEEFPFEDQIGTIIHPNVTPNGRLVLKGEYRDAFPKFEQMMLERGYYVINVSHRNRYAPADCVELTARFVYHVAEKLNADKRCIMVGMSAGGTMSAKLAAYHPDLAAVLYLDAPGLNLLSLAGLGQREVPGHVWQELVNGYGFDRITLINHRDSPIDHLDKLIANDIPVIMVYGNRDVIAPYCENGKVLEDYYNAHGGKLKVIEKSMCGHHPHGLEDPTPIVEFVEQFV